MTASEMFKKYAEQWLTQSPISVVPIIGSGVNMQAATMHGSGKVLNWDTLLKSIVDFPSISTPIPDNLPESFLRKWETILRIIAVNTRGYMPYRTEHDLQKKVQQILNEYEEECKEYDLYKLIVDSGFQDIISLNFDRCIALAGATKSVISLNQEKSKDGVTLYRHSHIKTPHHHTRVWYPHGDTKRLDTIKLGIRKYGVYINWIESMRGTYMSRWYEEDQKYCNSYGGDWIPPHEWDRVVRTWNTPASWVNIFKSAPLLFIGCSLLPDEWPLWYLLNQRARQTAFLDQEGSPDDRPETIILTAGSNRPPHIRNEPEYLINIHFDSYTEMWKEVIDFLEKAKKITRTHS